MNSNNKSLYEFINMSEGDFPIRCHHSVLQQKGPTFPCHWHEHIEFHYYTKGSAIVYCDSSPIYAKAGDLVVINSNELHSGENTSGELEYICIIVGVDHLHSSIIDPVETKYITPIERNLIMFQNKISGVESVAECIKNIVTEYNSKQVGFELEIKSNIYHLLALLMRNQVKKVLSRSEYRLRARNLERFGKIFGYIDEHYADELTIHTLSCLVNLSGFHFCRLFKEITGKTLSGYINRVRIEKADRLLLEHKYAIGEVALLCGYNDINYFSRMFRRYRNMSPSQFRTTSQYNMDN
ncbi:MAG: helix-turn-helix domain-containing protein [Ruminiclostridium sp.]|nr:helix-turn-helix domain-containing protein [Ruminiclostridium sp.]